MSDVIPDGWTNTKIGDAVLSANGGVSVNSENRTKTFKELGILKTSSVFDGRFYPNEHKAILSDEIERVSISPRKNHILFSRMNTPVLVGQSGFVNKDYDDLYLPDRLWQINVCESFDARWLSYTLRSESVVKHITDAATGTSNTMKNIAKPNLMAIPMQSPPLPEQQKIAAILSSVDEVIEKTQAQIEKLKDLKTGMMQELLSPREDQTAHGTGAHNKNGTGLHHTEFKDSPLGRIPVGWEVTSVNSLVNVIESGWSPQCEQEKAGTGEWGILKTTAVTWDGFDYNSNKKLPDALEPRPLIQVNQGDILITRAGPSERVGVVAYVNYVPEKIMLSDKIIRLSINENYDSRYISYWLSSGYVKNFFSLRATGLAQSQTNISQDILKRVLCAIPTLDEQRKISSAVFSIEKQLKSTIKRNKKYLEIKKALMQDLLTGKVRVTAPSHPCDHGISASMHVKEDAS